MDFTLSIISGIISGIVASGVFYLYMQKMRPKLFICDEICKMTDDQGVYYGFKLYNQSSRYDVLDLKFEVFIKTPFYSHGGQNFKIDRLTLKRDRIMVLPKFSRKNKDDVDFV